MKQQKTIYHLIVDKSGSMSDCIDNTINGFNEQVKKIQMLSREFPEQEMTIGLTMFNHEVQHHSFQSAPHAIEMLNRKTYQPNGNTALLDAIGLTVQRLENEQYRSNNQLPTTVVVVILTDGEENSSGMFSLADIRSTIQRLSATEKWTFSFLGATLDAVEVAEQMAIHRDNSFSFEKTSMQEAVWDKLSSGMHSYMDKKRKGERLNKLFKDNDESTSH